MQRTPAIRIDAENPDHHLCRDRDGFAVRYTIRRDDGAPRRVRHALGTADVVEARRRRDALFARLDAAASAAADFAAFDHPDSIWNLAAASEPQGDPFCCRTEWQFSFHEAFAPHRRLHLRRDGDSVLGFAELRHGQSRLLTPLEASWLFGTPLFGPRAPELLVALLAEPLWQEHPPDVLISGLLPGSPLLQRLARAFGRRYALLQCEPRVQCSAALAGGLDGFLSRRSRKLRANLRTAARAAADRGVFFERHAPATIAAADAVYARMLAVEEASWKGVGRCGMAEPPSRDYYARMLRRLAASGTGRVVFARRDERDIGFIFGGLAGRVYRGQQFSFAEDWRAASIGNLLQIAKIRWLCEQGIERYDMGPVMDYKHHWTEQQTSMATLLLQAGGGR
jgi:CelD/BcsL family acetyltransferase involved in cellulose biosynthesis